MPKLYWSKPQNGQTSQEEKVNGRSPTLPKGKGVRKIDPKMSKRPRVSQAGRDTGVYGSKGKAKPGERFKSPKDRTYRT